MPRLLKQDVPGACPVPFFKAHKFTDEPAHAEHSRPNAGLAQSKGRSGLNWWLLSLLMGPIGTLLIIVLQPVTGKTES
ncbi:MAG TPA: hypothetical protein PKE27_10485 [Povalibacter sp.]|uniref:hypothetical protein n=1 Tax=Povalibacter sp. TaxID=1962978 RepID=UPI002C5F54D9|nr:hypothetical protein [Povalibacter sp.]HMN44993.1 hypothetical protein [Povalibacter sp.]